MTEYAVKHMKSAAADHARRATEFRALAAQHREDTVTADARAEKEDQRASALRAAIAKLQPEPPQWSKDDLARFAAEGHSALNPPILSPVRETLRGKHGDGIVDLRVFQPDGDTYGSDFTEPHIG